MPRSGITREQVFEAANRLVEQGITPTPALIRNALGKGSFTTISQHLSAWKDYRWHSENNLQWIPKSVETKAMELIQETWEAATRDAIDEIERLQADYTRQVEELQTANQQLMEKLAHLEAENQALRQKLLAAGKSG